MLVELVAGRRAGAPAGADPAPAGPPAPVRNGSGNGTTRPGDRAPVTRTGPPAR